MSEIASEFALRGTGRTTRMLEKALEQVGCDSARVTIVCASERQCDHNLGMFRGIAELAGLTVVPQRRWRVAIGDTIFEFVPPGANLRGIRSELFTDHAAWPHLCEPVVSEVLRIARNVGHGPK